ncbi:MAG: magnesium protoporphyrin IX methyltransferase [Pseudomonadota bacterium]
MSQSYLDTRARLEAYFDRTAAKTWERLTSDAPVSRIRETVRQGRDQMRVALLACLPKDLSGARVLDAGCGAGQMCVELARRGARVTGIDISPSLLEVAEKRTPDHLKTAIKYYPGDMLSPREPSFDYIVAMDSVIHYENRDIAAALTRLVALNPQKIAFTVAPRTPLLMAMHRVGKLFPRSDRSPAIVPTNARHLSNALAQDNLLPGWTLKEGPRVNSGFYISQAMELTK